MFHHLLSSYAESLTTFRSRLKTFLFSIADLPYLELENQTNLMDLTTENYDSYLERPSTDAECITKMAP